jgi:hypothetical protein
MSDEIAFDRALDAVLESESSTRTPLASVGLGESSVLEGRFEASVARASRDLDTPAFDDRRDRASIDTWYPEAVRLAAWVHRDGLVFLAIERRERQSSLVLLVGYVTDDEFRQRRTYRGHSGVVSPRPNASPLRREVRERHGRPMPPDGRPPDRHYRHRPRGLQPLSPRESQVRWIILAACVVMVVVLVALLVLGARPGT